MNKMLDKEDFTMMKRAIFATQVRSGAPNRDMAMPSTRPGGQLAVLALTPEIAGGSASPAPLSGNQLIFFKAYLFLRGRERDRDRAGEGEGQRERETESEAGSRL